MTIRTSLALAMTLVLVGFGGPTTAQPQERQVTLQISATGPFLTLIDTNGDGITATIRGGVVTGTLGRMISQFESESLAPLPTPVNCPPSTQEVPLLQSFVTLTSLRTGDRLFYEYESGFTCVNAPEGTFTFTGQGHWAGGTGQFAGATGRFEAHFTGIVHVADPNGHTFDSATGTVRGLLRVP